MVSVRSASSAKRWTVGRIPGMLAGTADGRTSRSPATATSEAAADTDPRTLPQWRSGVFSLVFPAKNTRKSSSVFKPLTTQSTK